MRVARGPRLKSLYAPAAGYRYDGLYFVEDYWEDTGKAGFKIWRYRFRRDDPERPSWEPAPMLPEQAEPGRRETTIQRIIRNTAVAMGVKELHGYCCQVCGVSLQFAGGLYAEGAHIRPLGRPHNGPDVAENILCLCPNHHVLFDDGAFGVADDFSLIGIEGRLRTVTGHTPGPTYLAYHREHYLRIEPAA